MLDWRVDEADTPFSDGGCVPASRLADDDGRVIDTDYEALRGAAGERRNRDAGPAAEFDDAVSRLDLQELDRPPVAPDVRLAMAEQPTFEMTNGSGRAMSLREQAAAKTVRDGHATSRALQVRSKSSGRCARYRRSLSRPEFLSIGELAERTGVATSALRYYDELSLVQPAARESGGRRRYDPTALAEVGVIRFLRDVGLTLAEIDSFLAAGEQLSRQEVIERKLAEFPSSSTSSTSPASCSSTAEHAPRATRCAALGSGQSSRDTATASHLRSATRECTSKAEFRQDDRVSVLTRSVLVD